MFLLFSFRGKLSSRTAKDGRIRDLNCPLDQMTAAANRITADQFNPQIADYVKRRKDAFLSQMSTVLMMEPLLGIKDVSS